MVSGVIRTHSLSIALLDWTIKQKRQNRNMGNVCVFALNFQYNVRQAITIKVDFFYAVRAGTEQEEIVK